MEGILVRIVWSNAGKLRVDEGWVEEVEAEAKKDPFDLQITFCL